MAGAYVALGLIASAISSSQVIAFILAIASCFALTALSAPIINHLFVQILNPELFSFIVSLSFLSRFVNIAKGILDLRDVLFFISFIITALYITCLIIDSRKFASSFHNLRKLYLPSTISLIVFLAFNFAISQVQNLRFDLTQDKIFSISENSQKIVSSLDKKTKITFYYSQKLDELSPSYALFANRVEGLLLELNSIGNDNLKVSFVDPIPFEKTEDDAIKDGLRGITIEDNSKVYIGINVSLVEKDNENHENNNKSETSVTIPLLQPDREQFIEYDITKALIQVQQDAKSKIGIISSLDIFGMPDFSGRTQGSPAWIAFEQAQELFDLKNIFSPQDLYNEPWDLVIIVHPDNKLEPDFIYAIDQYLLKGGSLLIFADPKSEVQPGAFGTPDASSIEVANKILKQTGVSIDKNQIIGDAELATSVNTSELGVFPYVSWLQISKQQMNSSLPSFAQISDMLIPTPGIISTSNVKNENLSFQTLINSSDKAIPLALEEFEGSVPDLQKLYQTVTTSEDKQQSLPIAIRINGSISSNFPEGRPTKQTTKTSPAESEKIENPEKLKEELEEEEESFVFPDHIKNSQAPFSVTLVSDVDFLRDRFWVQAQNLLGQRIVIPQADNGAWLLNLIEVASDNPLLIGLRARGRTSRPFTRFEELQKQANLLFLSQEQNLRQKLDEIETKISELSENQIENQRENLITEDENIKQPDQEQIIKEFTQNLVDTRKKLREVRSKLRQKQNDLENLIIFFNIGFLPIVILLVSFLIFRLRRAKTLKNTSSVA